MRIAIFAETFLPKLDGITTTLCYLLPYLREQGHSALLFAPKGGPAEYAGTRVIGLPAVRFPLYRDLQLVPPVVRVSQALTAFGPDLIHLVNPASLGLLGMGEAFTRQVPIVASYHTDLPGYTRRYGWSFMEQPMWAYLRFVHNASDLNLAPSEFTRRQLVDHGFKRVRLWGRGVDTERYSPVHRSPAWRQRLSGGHPEKPLLLYVGRLAAEKRVDWLRAVVDAVPQAALAIVGDGPERPELERQFASSGAVFTGFLTGADLAAAYASSDLFVFPSANETLGNVVLEAMASGLPVIAPRSGGPVDHVIDNQNGYMFAADRQEDLVTRVADLVARPHLVQRLGVCAREYACTQTWEHVFQRLLSDYEEAISSRRCQRPAKARGGLAPLAMLFQNLTSE